MRTYLVCFEYETRIGLKTGDSAIVADRLSIATVQEARSHLKETIQKIRGDDVLGEITFRSITRLDDYPDSPASQG